MKEQVGWRGFLKNLKAEAPQYATLLPQLPRLIHQRLNENSLTEIALALHELSAHQRKFNQWLMSAAVLLTACGLLLLYLVVRAT